MSSFFKIVIEHHRRNRLRDANFDFFKACMAAAAMIAIADEHACRKESTALKALVRTLEDLNLYDTSHGLEIYNRTVAAIEADAVKGQAQALKQISAARKDPQWATLLVAICGTMSEADGIVVQSEIESILRICALLDVDSNMVQSIAIDDALAASD